MVFSKGRKLKRAIELPVWVFDRAGAIAPGDPAQNAEPKWCYADGANRLGKLLAEGLDVRQSTRVERLARDAQLVGAEQQLIAERGQGVGAGGQRHGGTALELWGQQLHHQPLPVARQYATRPHHQSAVHGSAA